MASSFKLACCSKAFVLFVFTATVLAQQEQVDWTGTWETRWRGGAAVLRLQQAGNKVTGSYPLLEGTVEGTVNGRILDGNWSQTGASGKFLFAMAEDGGTFMGRFDSGEWWTGTRLSRFEDYRLEPANLSNPRETLRFFLKSVNEVRGGMIERIRPALDTIEFDRLQPPEDASPDDPLLPSEKIAYARKLFQVLDELTFRFWSLPGPDAPELEAGKPVTVTLRQAGTTNTFDLRFVQQSGKWRIDPPPQTELDAALVRLYERRGGQPPTAREHLLLQNPRDTMRTFIEGMRRFDLGGSANVLRTLDLKAFGPNVPEEDTALLAQYLKRIIDRIGHIVYQEIPNDPAQREAYVHFRHGLGNVVIAPFRQPEGGQVWRFTAETLNGLRDLYAGIEDMPSLAQFSVDSEQSLFFTVRDRLRGFAPSLLKRTGLLERWQWICVLILVLASILLTMAVTFVVLWILRRRGSPAATTADRRTRLRLLWPLRLTLLGIFWYPIVGFLGLPQAVSGPWHAVAATLTVVGAAWLVWNGIGRAMGYSGRAIGSAGQTVVLTSLTFGILRILTVVAAALLLAEAWSVPYSSVLAGLGIGGLAVALSAQPTLQNMIAGFTLFADSPLSVGDFCRYGDRIGTVEQIGLRSTRIRSLARTVVSIPNSEFANLQLENFAKRDRILFRTTLGLRYETTPDQLRFTLAELRRLLIAHPEVHEDPARVRFSGYGAYSLDLEIFAYVGTSDWNRFLAIREDLLLRIMDVVRRSGTGFAFPSQVNYLSRDAAPDATLTEEAEQAVETWRQDNRLPFPEFPSAEVRDLRGILDYPPKGSPDAPPTSSK
jgi:small-conductance mechanosensitive channel